MAKEAGKELVMTPIGKEAFVFFVNPDNNIDSLAVSEIKDIYSGKIKNWSKLRRQERKNYCLSTPRKFRKPNTVGENNGRYANYEASERRCT